MDNSLNLDQLLSTFRLTSIPDEMERVNEIAIGESWTYPRYLAELLSGELSVRILKKQTRLLKQSQLPQGKSLATLDLKRFSAPNRKQLSHLLEGNFVQENQNVLAFGLPGRGKTHFLCAIGHELIIRYQYKVRFVAVFRLVQELLEAKSQLRLNHYLKKQKQYDVIILDDIGYVQQTREEMEAFFIFLAECYEQKSLMISSNQNFSQWGKIFHDPMTAMAAIDRLVHHSVIVQFGGSSYRTKRK